VRAVKDTVKARRSRTKDGRKAWRDRQGFLLGRLARSNLVLVVDAPDNATATAFGVSIGALGNVRTQTPPGIQREEMAKILGRTA